MTYLRRFNNLLLDEDVDFDIHKIELERLLHLEEVNEQIREIQSNPNISNFLNSESLARKILMHDLLPCMCIGRYEMDGPCHVVEIKDEVSSIQEVKECTEIIVPTHRFERSNITDQAKARAWFLKQENDALLGLLDKTKHRVIASEFNAASINLAFREIEINDGVVTKIIVSKDHFDIIREFGSDFFSPYHDRYNPNFVGHLWTADIYCCNHPILKKKTFFTASPDTVGVFVDRGYTSTFSWHVEDYGMALIHPNMVSCLECG